MKIAKLCVVSSVLVLLLGEICSSLSHRSAQCNVMVAAVK